MVPRMSTDDWEKFERFGPSDINDFVPLHESIQVLGRYKTERRDKRSLRVAAYAPAVGMAVGAAHGHNKAEQFLDKVGRHKAASRSARAERRSGIIARTADKARKLTHGVSRAYHLPGKAVHGARSAMSAAVKPPKPRLKSVSFNKPDTVDTAKGIGKGIMKGIDRLGQSAYMKNPHAGSATAKKAYGITKKHALAGLAIGTAVGPATALVRLRNKKRAHDEEIGRRSNF